MAGRILVSKATYALAAACLAAAGAAVAFTLLSGPPIASVGEADGEQTWSARAEPFTDRRSVELELVQPPATKLLSPSAGVVTAFDCLPGKAIASGSFPLQIAGEPKLALATAVPPWRDFAAGLSGRDVVALQQELRRLGHYGGADTGRYDTATRQAVRKLFTAAGHAAPDRDLLMLSSVVWLPQPDTKIDKCEISIGWHLAGSMPIAVAEPPLQAVTLKSTPGDLVAGKRRLEIAGRTFETDETGRLTASADLAQVAATDEFRRFRESGGQTALRGSYELASPVEVYGVPPSAVLFGGGGRACVVSTDGRRVDVTVVSSTMGRSIVRVAEGATLPPIKVKPPRESGCG